ncbi:hypothetical protein SESI111939_00930 [Serratia silvae]
MVKQLIRSDMPLIGHSMKRPYVLRSAVLFLHHVFQIGEGVMCS